VDAVVVAGAPKENPPDDPDPAPKENPDMVQDQSGDFVRPKRNRVSAFFSDQLNKCDEIYEIPLTV